MDPLFSASKWMLLRDTLLRTLLGEDVVAEYPAGDDAGVGLLCDTLLRTLLVWGCCSKWMLLCDTLLRTMLGEDTYGALCCCGRCCLRVWLLDMQEQIRGPKLANKGSRFWTPYFVYVAARYAVADACRRFRTWCEDWLGVVAWLLVMLISLKRSDVIQTGHIWFFQLAVCFWVLGLPLFHKTTHASLEFGLSRQSATWCGQCHRHKFFRQTSQVSVPKVLIYLVSKGLSWLSRRISRNVSFA